MKRGSHAGILENNLPGRRSSQYNMCLLRMHATCQMLRHVKINKTPVLALRSLQLSGGRTDQNYNVSYVTCHSKCTVTCGRDALLTWAVRKWGRLGQGKVCKGRVGELAIGRTHQGPGPEVVCTPRRAVSEVLAS